jgi:hypothetical protein
LKKLGEAARRRLHALRSAFTFSNIVQALAAALLIYLAASVKSTVETQLDLEGRLRLWVAVVIAVVALGTGILLGVVFAKRAKQETLRAEEAEKDARELEKEKLEDKLREVEADNQLKTRTSAYIAHFQSVLDDVLRGELSLAGFPRTKDDRLRAAFCELPSKQIEDETGQEVALSIWVESKSKLRRGKFDVVFDANHEMGEVAEFDVKVRGSYLRQALEHLKQHPETSRLHKLDNLDKSSDFGDDIAAFRAHGYRSLRAVAVDLGGKPVRLVALSKQSHTFGEFEDKYLLLLWCALEVAARLPAPAPSTGSGVVALLPQDGTSEH